MHEKASIARSAAHALSKAGSRDGTHLHGGANKGVDGRVVSKDTRQSFMSTSSWLIGAGLERLESGNPMSWWSDDRGGGCGSSVSE